jgi:hypothetical protein
MGVLIYIMMTRARSDRQSTSLYGNTTWIMRDIGSRVLFTSGDGIAQVDKFHQRCVHYSIHLTKTQFLVPECKVTKVGATTPIGEYEQGLAG